MAANESAAVAACRAYASAQNTFRRTDYNNNTILEYAQQLYSASVDSDSVCRTTGGDGLYTLSNGTSTISLIDLAFAKAEGKPNGNCAPKAGYAFRIQYSDTKTVYTNTAGLMTIGFGLSAAPFAYDGTGRSNFQINTMGTVYQKDCGDQTQSTVWHTNQFNVTNWAVTE